MLGRVSELGERPGLVIVTAMCRIRLGRLVCVAGARGVVVQVYGYGRKRTGGIKESCWCKHVRVSVHGWV